MVDIAMCFDNNCPSRNCCYRFVATPNPFWQTYSSFYRYAEDDKCRDFWPMENK